MKSVSQDSLYRSFIPKYPRYSPDGMGRDTYIKYNNGGMLSNNIHIQKHNEPSSLQNIHFKNLGYSTDNFI